MRMLALVTDGFGGAGGIARFNQDLLQACSELDEIDEVVVLPRYGDTEHQSLPQKVQQLPPQPSRLGYVTGALKAVRHAGPFDVVFCGHLYQAPLAAILAKIGGGALWLQLHGIEAWMGPSRLCRWAAERAALVSAVSRYTRRRFLAWAMVTPERVRVLPNTVHDRFQPGPKPQSLLGRYGLEGKRILLTVGRLAAAEQYKGHDKVIGALPALLGEFPDLRYLIAGSGDDAERLRGLARSLGVEQQVQFLGDVDDKELVEVYHLADAYVMPSTGEGFGIVFLEAAACGIPVVGGNRDGSLDALVNGQLGAAVDPDDQASLVRAIVHAVESGRRPNAYLSRFSRSNFYGQVQRMVQLIDNPERVLSV